MGFETISTSAESTGELIRKFPLFRNNFPELRQWTVRQKSVNEEVKPKKERGIKKQKESELILIDFDEISIGISNEDKPIDMYDLMDYDLYPSNIIAHKNEDIILFD